MCDIVGSLCLFGVHLFVLFVLTSKENTKNSIRFKLPSYKEIKAQMLVNCFIKCVYVFFMQVFQFVYVLTKDETVPQINT